MYVCGICGSPDIEVQMWVNMNTLDINGDVLDGSDECWCNHCNGHTYFKEEQDVIDTDKERKVSDEEGIS